MSKRTERRTNRRTARIKAELRQLKRRAGNWIANLRARLAEAEGRLRDTERAPAPPIEEAITHV